ncbi:MAG: endonuclease domain-containing protein [Prevotella sp.]|uniref:endonuclease domain-containing protein n=1 Tax=uncultured Prevotella sp. TaxID=159272 RepID=UPI0025F8BEDB|nr:endonuclease domain-containing protein [Prevotella sp.]MCI7182728.1 endonuclease domain-containing protein [Prevotella sp.]
MSKKDSPYMMASPDIYPILKANARKNRGEMTLAESLLWDCLKAEIPDYHFRRQYVIGDYIADFACLSRQLVIEVDGEYHFTDEQQLLDEARTEFLNKRGFYVMRFTNQEVMNEIDNVIESIEEFLNE